MHIIYYTFKLSYRRIFIYDDNHGEMFFNSKKKRRKNQIETPSSTNSNNGHPQHTRNTNNSQFPTLVIFIIIEKEKTNKKMRI